MILAQERIDQRKIFQAVRRSVQELHPDRAIQEDANGIPFLFKSHDAQIWVRIFYRAMQDFSLEELREEIRKLWVLMPKDATLYLFYPVLDRGQILKMNGFSDRLSFFESGNFSGPEVDKCGVHICKWIPSIAIVPLSSNEPVRPSIPKFPLSGFLQNTRLTVAEIAALTELALASRQF